jgi:phosphatidyl-myo-inositol dimannoside synthase
MLLISRVFPPMVGGSGRWFWELYRRLPREEFVTVAGSHPDAAQFDSTHDLDVRRLPLCFSDYGTFSLRGINRYRRVARLVLKVAREGGVGAIHCGALLPDGWIGRLVAKQLGLPLLVYLHGEEVCYTNSSRQLNWMARRVLRDAVTVVVNSRNTHQLAIDHWQLGADKLRLLHPGVDCGRYVPAERSFVVRERLGWGNRPVILTVGRLQKRKGHDMLIRALPAIRECVPGVFYAIVGEGEERKHLEQLVDEMGLGAHVRFHGECADAQLIECYQQCDLFVLPNRRVGDDIEGFGMVLIEAQACGKPVIAGNSGGTAEAMNDPETGLVINCADASLIAAAVQELLPDTDRLQRMGVAARHWVVNHFDWSVLAPSVKLVFAEARAQRFAPAMQIG